MKGRRTPFPVSEKDQSLSAAGLIERLTEVFSVDKDRARIVAVERIQKNQMPLYLRGLIGVGAFLSAIFLIGIFTISMSAGENELFAFGLVITIAALALYIASRRLEQYTPSESFLSLFSFALILAGKTMLVFAGKEIFATRENESFTLFVISLICTCATYPVYALYMDRLVSFTSTLIMGLFWFSHELSTGLGWDELGANAVFFTGITPMAFVMMIHPGVTRTFRPISIGLVLVSVWLGLGLTEAAPGINQLLGLFYEDKISVGHLIALWAVPVSMFFVFVYVVQWSVGGWKGMRKRLLAFSILGALVLCASMMTSPVLALALIVLGYAQHDRIISISGTLLLPVALFMFTRQLELGLMNTGILLMVQALVLLAVFFAFRAWAFSDGNTVSSDK